MLATEHADRFTVALPNGGTMDVFKADLRPETAAELRSMVVPALADGDNVTDAELDALTKAADALTEEIGGIPPERYLRRAAARQAAAQGAPDGGDGGWQEVLSYDPKAVKAARYGAGDERDAGTLAEGLSLQGDVPLPAGDTYDGGSAAALRTAADDLTAAVGDIPVPEVVGPPAWLAGGGAQQPAGSPAMPLSEFAKMPDAGDGIPSMPPEFYKPLPVMGRGELAKLEGERRMIARGRETGIYDVPPEPPAAPPAPPVDPDAEKRAEFQKFMRGAEEDKPFKPLSVGAATPFDATGITNAFDAAQQANKDVADFDMKAGALREQREIDAELKKQAMIDRHAAERIAEQRRLDQMREDAFNGKIDVNRAFDRMDNGQRALSLIGLILGGIGAGNTGVNAAVAVMDRMIDRDIDAQAKDLGRKQTAYSHAIQQGYQAEQARQVAKAEAFSLLDGAIARAAAKSNSDRAMLNAQAMNAELGVKRENTLTQARDAHEARDGQRLDRQLRADGMNLELQLKREANEIARKSATIKAMIDMRKGDAKVAHTLPDKTVVLASNPTSKAKLEEIQSAHEDMLAKISEARALREKYGGGTIAPNMKILRATGLPAAVYADEAASLAGQMELSWLRGEGAGAYDKGSGEKAKEIMPSAADLGEEAFKNKMDRLERLAGEQFRSKIIALTQPESAQRF